MKIGLRTIKTVVSATLAMIIANYLGLRFPSTAGIIAILSVTNTKTSSFKVGIGRILALFVAIFIAFISFHLIGYTPIAFGLFLLMYIPTAVKFKWLEAIPVNSVLITHFLNEKEMSWPLIGNTISLLFLGVGLALVANLYMPNMTGKIRQNKEKLDTEIKNLLKKMSDVLIKKEQFDNCNESIEEIRLSLINGEKYATTHLENSLLTKDYYDMSYFQMRRMQLKVLEDMLSLIKDIEVDVIILEDIYFLVEEIHDTYSEENDGIKLKNQVETVRKFYEKKDLPITRVEFENRARLFQFLTEIQTFIDIKVDFNSIQQK